MVSMSYHSDKIDDLTELSHLILSVTDVLKCHVGHLYALISGCLSRSNLLIQVLMLKLRDIREHTDHLLNYSWPLLCPLNHTLNYKENAVIYMDITWGTEGFWYHSLQHFHIIKCVIRVTYTEKLQVSFKYFFLILRHFQLKIKWQNWKQPKRNNVISHYFNY